MFIFDWLKNLFSIFFRKDTRESQIENEIGFLRRAEQAARGKLRTEMDEERTTLKLKSLFRRLPGYFQGAVKKYVKAECDGIKRIFLRLEKDNIVVEEREVQRAINEWERLKTHIMRIMGTENRDRVTKTIELIDISIEKLTADIAKEAGQDAAEADNLEKATQEIAQEEGAPQGTPVEALQAGARQEQATADSQRRAAKAQEVAK